MQNTKDKLQQYVLNRQSPNSGNTSGNQIEQLNVGPAKKFRDKKKREKEDQERQLSTLNRQLNEMKMKIQEEQSRDQILRERLIHEVSKLRTNSNIEHFIDWDNIFVKHIEQPVSQGICIHLSNDRISLVMCPKCS